MADPIRIAEWNCDNCGNTVLAGVFGPSEPCTCGGEAWTGPVLAGDQETAKPKVEWDPANPRVLRFPDGSTAEGPNVTSSADELQGILHLNVSYKASGGMALEFVQAWAKSMEGNKELEDMFGKLSGIMGEPDTIEIEPDFIDSPEPDFIEQVRSSQQKVADSFKMPAECDHYWVDWRGHNSSTLDQKCTKCGKLKDG